MALINKPGDGGDGVYVDITGTNLLYATGGGGGTYATDKAGGVGGNNNAFNNNGGNNNTSPTTGGGNAYRTGGTAGQTGTGAGGGGGGSNLSYLYQTQAGNGDCGIVIIKCTKIKQSVIGSLGIGGPYSSSYPLFVYGDTKITGICVIENTIFCRNGATISDVSVSGNISVDGDTNLAGLQITKNTSTTNRISTTDNFIEFSEYGSGLDYIWLNSLDGVYLGVNNNTVIDIFSDNVRIHTPSVVLDDNTALGVNNRTYLSFNTGDTTLSAQTTGKLRIKNTAGTDADRLVWNSSGVTVYGTFTNSSDERIKENIKEVNISEALETINKLIVKNFGYKNKAVFGSKYDIGFIAQEVYEIIPEAILIDENKSLSDINETGVISSSNILSCKSDLCLNDKIDIKYGHQNYDIIIDDIIDSSNYHFKTLDDQILKEKEDIFINGHVVDDFHLLNKQYIYDLSISAIQELSRQLTSALNRITALENKINNL